LHAIVTQPFLLQLLHNFCDIISHFLDFVMHHNDPIIFATVIRSFLL
jgi:hypothetical protein